MKRILRFCLIFILMVSFPALSACKKKADGAGLSSGDGSFPAADITVNNVPDDALDPENTENGLQGNQVQLQDIAPQHGEALGIDVSKWQGKIDWPAVKKSSIDFAIIRMGYRAENGKLYKDENADYNIQQAQKAGVLVGVYFFSTAVTASEAQQEAAFTVSAIKGYSISYPVVYDCEGYSDSQSRMAALTADERTKNALTFLSAVKKAGYEGMFYGAKSEIENPAYWNISEIASNYKIWVAQYSSPTYPEKETPDYTGRFDMWQYTNRGSVNGVTGNCDMVVSYFISDKKKPLDSTVSPDTASVPKTEAELQFTAANDRVTAKIEVNLRLGPSTKYEIAGVLKSGEFLSRTGIGKNGWSRLTMNGKTVYAITGYLTNTVVETKKEDIVSGVKFTPANDQMTAKDEVNLRDTPTTNGKIVGVLKSGSFLPRTAIGDKGWSRLSYNGQSVYAITSYLSATAPTVSSVPVQSADTGTFTEFGMQFQKVTSRKVTAKSETNLRAEPKTGADLIHTLKSGEFVTEVAQSTSGWSKLSFNGQTVYAVTSYLTETVTVSSAQSQSPDSTTLQEYGMTFTKVTPQQVTAKEETNLRDKPSSDGKIVHTLKNGETATLNAKSEKGWARLEYGGQTVYAVASYLQ